MTINDSCNPVNSNPVIKSIDRFPTKEESGHCA